MAKPLKSNILRSALFLITVMVSVSSMAVDAEWSLAEKLAVIVNANDPDSQRIADYYQQKRNIPDENIIVIKFPSQQNIISKVLFQKLYIQVKEKTPEHVQFYALAWSNVFRVGCMSITSAFALGYDEKYCAMGCKATAPSPYFNVTSRAPFDDLKIRPTMMLGGSSIDQVFAMIDRGVRSDEQSPDGTAYLLSTTDKARNTRAQLYAQTIITLSEYIKIQQVNANKLEDKDDVMFYFTGMKQVEKIDSNEFMDGAIADHLTSAGGVLFGKSQMSLLRWLDAGATASYGTVVEPCNFIQKFTHPGVVIGFYIQGESLIEAYWKSVAWPGQGLFVGEPLASPYAKLPVKQEEI
ncbi:MAG: TIGR03790 family protein [Gammaproteobacteria bacterium]|nr:TIGR03790 family protein [Gammaproteobacteria bacterium]